MSLPFTALQTFLLAVRYGSLKRTAEYLHLTESAVSHQLKRLEAQLEQPLLYKSGRQLKPTEVGRRLYEQLNRPFSDIESVIATLNNTRPQTLTLYCLPSLLGDWLLPRLIPFKSKYPQYDLNIRYHQSAPDYLDESSVLIGSHDAHAPSVYQTVDLMDGETLAVCSPIYLSQYRMHLSQQSAIATPQGLLQADLLHDHTDQAWRDWFARQSIDYNESAHLIYEDFHLLKMATMAAQGIALCPRALIQPELASGQLVALFSQRGNIGRRYVLEYSRHPLTGIRQLIEFLAKVSV